MPQVVDVVVIGLGPGGEDVAGKLAEAGLEVVGVERQLVGGECPYWGCIPSKMMIRAANLIAETRRVPGIAGEATVRPDYTPVAQRIREEATDNWDDGVAVDRLRRKGARFVRGTGRLTGVGEVAVGDEVFRTRVGVVIATGTTASVPPIEGLAGTPYWTNREAIEAKEPPASLVVIGGGAVGLELAQAFARFGTNMTVLEATDRLLPVEEPEAGHVLADVLSREGVNVRTGAAISSVGYGADTFTVSVDGEDVQAQRLLVATGRSADLDALGLDTVGIDRGNRWLDTDEHQRVAEGLWAIGDITGKGAFTHVAMYQSAIAVRSVLGEEGPAADYRALPRVTFTDPEVGAVGLTEGEAIRSGIKARTAAADIASSARGWIHKSGNDGFIKLVADADRGVLVGATSVGPAGGEVLGALAVAVHAQVPVDSLTRMMFAYPTFHRAIEDALRHLHQPAPAPAQS